VAKFGHLIEIRLDLWILSRMGSRVYIGRCAPSASYMMLGTDET